MHFRFNQKIFVALIPIFLLSASCRDKHVEENVVARVGESRLYKSDVDEYFSDDQLVISEQEFIRRWIERELLYLEALKNQVDKSKSFQLTLKNSRKQLAASIQIQEYINSLSINVSNDEVADYFSKNKEEFKLSESAFLINMNEFSDRTIAELFRTNVLKTNWANASVYIDKEKLISSSHHILVPFQKIEPVFLSRIVQNMQNQEVSLVIEKEPNKFILVQLIDKFSKGEILPLEYLREDILERIKMIKRNTEVAEFIKTLYNKYDIEINKDK